MPKAGLMKGWQRRRFDEMAVIVNDRIDNPSEAGVERYVGLEHLDSDSLTIRRWGLPSDVEATKLRFTKGDIIFGRRRVYQRKLAVANFDGICSAHAMVLRARPEVALSEFLPFFMQSDLFMERAKEISVGSLSPTINWKTLASQEFTLPPPEQQREIVNLLMSSEVYGGAIRVLVERSEDQRRSAIDRLTYRDEWPKVQLGDTCSMQNGRPFSGSEYSGNGIRLLRPGNLGASGYLSWMASKTVCLPDTWEQAAHAFIVDSGDVLINLTAQSLEEAFMGRVCLAKEGDRSLLNQRIGRFTNWSPDVLPEFVFRVLQSSRFQRHAIEMCEGTKVKHIFWPHLARFSFRLPPIAEQQTTIDKLQHLDYARINVNARASSHAALHSKFLAYTLDPAGSAGAVQ